MERIETPSAERNHLRCSICGATHEFEFVHARIDEKAQNNTTDCENRPP